MDDSLQKEKEMITIVASAGVVLSFFLPWGDNFNGINIVNYAIKAFDMSGYSNEWIAIGIVGLLFALSPIVCHALNLIFLLSGGSRKLCLTCVSLPVIIWLILLIVTLIQIGEIPTTIKGGIFKIGLVGTLIGQIVALVHQIVNFNRDKIIIRQRVQS